MQSIQSTIVNQLIHLGISVQPLVILNRRKKYCCPSLIADSDQADEVIVKVNCQIKRQLKLNLSFLMKLKNIPGQGIWELNWLIK